MQKNENMLHTQKKKKTKNNQWEISSQISNFESSRQRLKLAITDMLTYQRKPFLKN